MVNVLFVSGFNSCLEECENVDIYAAFKLYFMFSNDRLEFFQYKTFESLDEVYQRLKTILDTKRHDLLVTHSMGSCLLLKYIHETGDRRKTIMCMPFIQTSPLFKLITRIPLAKYMYLPKFIIVPNHNLFEGGNWFNDDVRLTPMYQPVTAVNEFFMSDDTIVHLIQSHKHIKIIYADDEQISPISKDLLDRIHKHVVYVIGKHVSFASVICMTDFFETFTRTRELLSQIP